eukprot:COSAG06_NODE_23238_length_698_cov_2.090150_1_plen_145_part_00
MLQALCVVGGELCLGVTSPAEALRAVTGDHDDVVIAAVTLLHVQPAPSSIWKRRSPCSSACCLAEALWAVTNDHDDNLMLRIWIGFWKLLWSLLVGAMPRFQFCDTEIWMHPAPLVACRVGWPVIPQVNFASEFRGESEKSRMH